MARSPLDAAILQQPKPQGIEGYGKRDEIPYDFERRRLSIVVEAGGDQLLITKGSPEGIFSPLKSYEAGGQDFALNESSLTRCRETYQKLSSEGFRTLAVAYAKVQSKQSFSAADEHDLTLAGFLTFADPPLTDAAETLDALRQNGVEVKIITGDSDLVTCHVCNQVGLDPGKVVLGNDLEQMTDVALAHVAEVKNLQGDARSFGTSLASRRRQVT